MVVQGQWDKDPLLLQVPHFNADIVGMHRHYYSYPMPIIVVT